MARPALTVRAAVEADLPAVLCLFDEMREGRGRAGRAEDQARSAAAERYLGAIAHPDHRLVVATDEADGGVVGMALLSLGPLSSLVETPSVVMSQVHVTGPARRRGAGRSLVTAAAHWAEERGADAVVVNVLPQSRESQRFYARLGFAPLVVRRAAPLAVLKRRLGQETVAPPMPSVGEAVHTAGRRGLRARSATARAVATARRRSV